MQKKQLFCQNDGKLMLQIAPVAISIKWDFLFSSKTISVMKKGIE